MARDGDDSLETVLEQRDEALRLLKEKSARIDKLEAQIAWLTKQLFGRRSERRLDPDTGDLFDPPSDAASPSEAALEDGEVAEPMPPSRPPRKVGGRRKLPEDLPRQVTEIFPPEEEGHCDRCCVDKAEIGREITERLEFEPGSLFVLREERVKLSCPSCKEGVACAPLPPRPIERGLPGPGLLAFVLTSKYGDHSTLYRLEDILARHGLSVSRSTMCGWVAAVATLLEPIVKEMKRQVVASGYVRSDDTTVRLLGDREKRKGSSRSYIWLYRSNPGLVVYEFLKGRSRDGPSASLEGFKGYLQVDGFASYDELIRNSRGRIVRVGCWAHVRRKFVDAEKEHPELAVEIVGMIRRLYAIEREARDRGLLPDDRLALRREKAAPVLSQIKTWLETHHENARPSGLLGKAIGYAVGQWDGLVRYAEDGILEIDNNATERAVKPVAIGRKNWLFFAREAGGERAATIFSLVHSCKELGIDPFAYLRDVLTYGSGGPIPGEIPRWHGR